MSVKVDPEKVIKVAPIIQREGGDWPMQWNETILMFALAAIVITKASGFKIDTGDVCACIIGATYFIVNAINKLRK